MSVPVSIVDAARQVVASVPLCDRCLGRFFARLGYGWSNKSRGDALKRLIVMEIHRKHLEGLPLTEDDFKVLENVGEQAIPLLRLIAPGRPTQRPSPTCAVCGGIIDGFIVSAARRGLSLLRAFDVRRFVVGAIVDPRILRLEDDIKTRFGLSFGESIKAELRREIGKLILSLDDSLTVDFEEPEATLLVVFPEGHVDIQVNSLLLAGRYWKLARMISQAYWPSPTGPRYFSVEEAAWGLLRVTGGERVVVHAAGREDVDARMLGTGRPLVVEVKAPRRRHLPLSLLEESANSTGKGVVAFAFERLAKRSDIQLYKEEDARLTKTYRALIISRDQPLSSEDILVLETHFTKRRIAQRTPRRVLHRRPDLTRFRTVHEVKCRGLGVYTMECLIRAEGGLYIKELISGDAGRTTPSFASVLSRSLECVELDVVAVEGGPLRLFYQNTGGSQTRVRGGHGEGSKGLPSQDKEAPPKAREGEGGGP